MYKISGKDELSVQKICDKVKTLSGFSFGLEVIDKFGLA